MGKIDLAIEVLESHFKETNNDDRFSVQGRYILLCMYIKIQAEDKISQWVELYAEKTSSLDRIGIAKAT